VWSLYSQSRVQEFATLVTHGWVALTCQLCYMAESPILGRSPCLMVQRGQICDRVRPER